MGEYNRENDQTEQKLDGYSENHEEKKPTSETKSATNASYMPLTIDEISKVKEIAMQKKYKLFREEKWKMNHILTDGDARLILETYLERQGI